MKSDFTSAMMSSSGTICPDLTIWTSWWKSKTSGPLLETRPLEAWPLEAWPLEAWPLEAWPLEAWPLESLEA
nr:hypothetical protein OH837_47480 [Streptomyces canus]